MANPKHRYVVETETGQTILEAVVATATPAKIEAQRLDSGLVRLVQNGEILATSTSYVPDGQPVTLRRWPGAKKAGRSTTRPVKPTSAHP